MGAHAIPLFEARLFRTGSLRGYTSSAFLISKPVSSKLKSPVTSVLRCPVNPMLSLSELFQGIRVSDSNFIIWNRYIALYSNAPQSRPFSPPRFDHLGFSLRRAARRGADGQRVLVQRRTLSPGGCCGLTGCTPGNWSSESRQRSLSPAIQMDVRCRIGVVSWERLAAAWDGIHDRGQCRVYHE